MRLALPVSAWWDLSSAPRPSSLCGDIGLEPVPLALASAMAHPDHFLLSVILALGLPGALPGQARAVPPRPVVFAWRAGPAGQATLRARTADLVHRTAPLQVTLRAIYKYDPQADAWTRLRGPRQSWTVPIPRPRQIYSADSDLILHTLPPVGLFWAIWDEDGQRYTSPAYAGPVLCNDVMLGPPPRGRVAMCVPLRDGGGARFVPDPTALSD